MSLIAEAVVRCFGLVAKKTMPLRRRSIAVQSSAKFYYDILYIGAGTEHNIDGAGWGRKGTGTGTGGDGSQSVREQVGTGVKGAGTCGDGGGIPYPCSRPHGAKSTATGNTHRKFGVEFGHVVPEMCERSDRQTRTAHRNGPFPYRGRSNYSPLGT